MKPSNLQNHTLFTTSTLGGAERYWFGFQGQEAENEIWGEGNASFYKYRISDNRLGRFFSVDPLYIQYPHNSTYAFSENRVLDGIELEGLEYYNQTARVGFQWKFGTKLGMNNYIHIDRMSYNQTKNALRTLDYFANNGKVMDNRLSESEINILTNSKINPEYKGYTPTEHSDLIIPKTKGQKIGYGMASVIQLFNEYLSSYVRSQINEDLAITALHIQDLNETVDLINAANRLDLIPVRYKDPSAIFDIAKYVLDSEEPLSNDSKYNEDIKALGKWLYDNKDDILMEKIPFSNMKNSDFPLYDEWKEDKDLSLQSATE